MIDILTRNKATILVVALVLIAAIAAGTTLAAYSAEVRTANAVGIGSVSITLTGDSDLPREIQPGETVSMTYTVKNTGKRDVYVRLLVKPDTTSATPFTLQAPTDSDWAEGDGKAYYNQILKAGKSVQVDLPLKAADSLKNGDTFGVKAVAHAVQAENYETLLRKNAGGKINGWTESFEDGKYTLEFEQK